MLQEKIYAIRQIREFSQEYIANKLGISQRAYSKLERGETKLDWERIKKIASILEVDPLELIKDDSTLLIDANGKLAKNKMTKRKTEVLNELLLHEKDKRIELLESQVALLKSLVNL